MSARILDGRGMAAEIWSEIEIETRSLTAQRGVAPHLAVLRVGDDPASDAYMRQISRSFTAHGLSAKSTVVSADTDQGTVVDTLVRLASDAEAQGVLLQLPLPTGLSAESLVESIPLEKDVDGLHPFHAGKLAAGRPTFVPSTPGAGLEILRRSGIELTGRLAVVIGRSQVVGRPMASLLLHADCTVMICHSRTANLASLTRQADILVAAVGLAGLVDGAMLKPGAVVIDFGTSEVDGRLSGDVDFESAAKVAGAITPVPGGTGPVTTAVLGRNLVQAARLQQGH